MDFLTLIWVGPLGVCFEGGRGGVVVKLPPAPLLLCRKLLRIMLETSNLARKYTHICSFTKYIFQYRGSPIFADVSIFLLEISVFWLELQQRFFSSVFGFCKINGIRYKINGKRYKFYKLYVWNPASGLLKIGGKLEKWQ